MNKIITISIIFFAFSFSIFAEEGNWEIGPQVNYSGYLKPEKYSHGLGLGVNTYYNLDDFWGVNLSFDYNKHLSKTGYVSNIYTGIIYNLDILRLIPVLETGISGTLIKNNEFNENFLSINFYAGIAFSYLLSWERSVAVYFRYQTALKSYDEVFDSYFIIGIRYNFIIESD